MLKVRCAFFHVRKRKIVVIISIQWQLHFKQKHGDKIMATRVCFSYSLQEQGGKKTLREEQRNHYDEKTEHVMNTRS